MEEGGSQVGKSSLKILYTMCLAKSGKNSPYSKWWHLFVFLFVNYFMEKKEESSGKSSLRILYTMSGRGQLKTHAIGEACHTSARVSHINMHLKLKGVWHEISKSNFCSCISFPLTPEYFIGAILNFCFSVFKQFTGVNDNDHKLSRVTLLLAINCGRCRWHRRLRIVLDFLRFHDIDLTAVTTTPTIIYRWCTVN